MKTKKYRKNTKKRYSNFSRKSKGGMYTDSDDDDGVMKYALALSKLDTGSSRGESSQAGPSRKDPSPVRPSSREESSDDEQLREAIDASIKIHLEDQKRKQEEEDSRLAQTLQKQEEDDFEIAEQELADIEQNDLNIALKKSLSAENKDWLREDLTLYQYWDTANWVRNLTIPQAKWIGSSAQPVIDIVPTKCHTGLHLGNTQVPDCQRQWSGKYRYTDRGRSSINDCGACMFTGLGYQLEYMSSAVPGMTNWELMRTTYGYLVVFHICLLMRH